MTTIRTGSAGSPSPVTVTPAQTQKAGLAAQRKDQPKLAYRSTGAEAPRLEYKYLEKGEWTKIPPAGLVKGKQYTIQAFTKEPQSPETEVEDATRDVKVGNFLYTWGTKASFFFKRKPDYSQFKISFGVNGNSSVNSSSAMGPSSPTLRDYLTESGIDVKQLNKSPGRYFIQTLENIDFGEVHRKAGDDTDDSVDFHNKFWYNKTNLWPSTATPYQPSQLDKVLTPKGNNAFRIIDTKNSTNQADYKFLAGCVFDTKSREFFSDIEYNNRGGLG